MLMEHKIFHTEPYHRGAKARQFFEAVKTGKLKDVEDIILDDKFIIYEYDTSDQTALHWAAKRDYQDIVKLLIDNGSDINKPDFLGRTPLFFAAKNNLLRVVKALLSAKAKPGIRNN